ncbi:DEAD/DEAH box helicase [Heliorestis convoluta]|uniref:DEAD/DEAH box helicase n=1 Tax=Heliorestis convoluta TaxID=356322 RepID=A0A5Q2N0K8_9FIRM|nr:DEAD/DEAH box helicase family protein [Heliorestis convoluta]QGG46802.1 DEAD/DEAH box helicase [Heliorestis convoluta]
MPKQRASQISSGDLELREHQKAALEELAKLRREGNSIALLTHATGTGKTTTAVLDAKKMNLPTLLLAHTRELVEQGASTFARLWPEAKVAIIDGDGIRGVHHEVHPWPYQAMEQSNKNLFGKETTMQDDNNSGSNLVLVSTIQYIQRNLIDFDPEQFGYIIIDEAHHATSRTYQQVIGYFHAQFLLGLTATPERMDGQSLLEIFQNVAHRMDLRQAIELGELVPIRCIRVKTNIDLSSLRFNGIRYQAKDLEEKLHIPERNQLIVQAYQELVAGERAVVFCVNVAHAEKMASLFQEKGIAARAVSGQQSRLERQKILKDYEKGILQVLCACDILNEGWDSPETRVLIMARPTLSKVIYLQQLGRGTRKAPGKESLLVIDFVDNGSKYNQALSLHRLFKIREYMAGRYVLASPEKIAEEKAHWDARQWTQERPDLVANLHLWLKDVERVDLFDWQEAVEHMWSHRKVAIELGVDDMTVRNWVKKGKIEADHELPLGRHHYYYFEPERLEEIRTTMGIPKRLPIYEEFFAFLERGDMSSSYKPVLLRAMVDLADETGRVMIADLVERFTFFYRNRAEQNLLVEKPIFRLSRVQDLTTEEIRNILFTMPFEKFERKGYFQQSRELTQVQWAPSLWRKLTVQDKERICNKAEEQIVAYYEHIEKEKRLKK